MKIRETDHLVENLTAEQFETERPGLVRSIFGPHFQDGFCTEPIENGIFTNPGWQCFLVPLVIDTLDRTCNIDDWDDRKTIHSPNYSEPVNWLEAIMAVHWSRAVENVIYARTCHFTHMSDADWEGLGPLPGPLKRVKAVASAIEGIQFPDVFFFRSMMLFDEAGEWGIVDCWDEAFLVLGAKGDLFDRFVSVFGGLPRITERMNNGFVEEYQNRYNPEDPGATSGLEAHYRMIYSQVGWDWPFEPHFDPEKFL